jgi:type I restriction enzyme S subunit
MTFPVTQVRRVAKVLNGGTPPSGQTDMWDGDIGFVTPPDLNGLDGAPIKQTSRTITREGLQHSALAPAGAVMLSTRAPIGHIARVETPVAFNQGCRALVARANVDERFLAYALVAAREQMNSRGLGTTFIELSGSSLAEIGIPLASLGTQRAIADYLDRETAQIDALIAKNEELIALLAERRASTLSSSIAGNRFGRMRLRQVLSVAQTGPFGTLLAASEYVEGGVPVINPSHILDGAICHDPAVSVTHERARELGRFTMRVDDIVLGRKGEVDKSAVVGADSAGFICGSDSMILRAAAGLVLPRYVWWFLQSSTAHEQLERFSVGSTVSGLNQRTLQSVMIPVPPLDEQAKVIALLDQASEAIQNATLVVQQAIDLARERRAALISAAVTGKIDVGVAA